MSEIANSVSFKQLEGRLGRLNRFKLSTPSHQSYNNIFLVYVQRLRVEISDIACIKRYDYRMSELTAVICERNTK